MLRDTHSGWSRSAALILTFPLTAYILAVGIALGFLAAAAVVDPTVSAGLAGFLVGLAVLCTLVMTPVMLAIEHGWHMPEPLMEASAGTWPAEDDHMAASSTIRAAGTSMRSEPCRF